MQKLLKFLDNSLLKWAVIAASLFIVLYPKLPSVHITHTWVYIRLEDFVIGALVILWGIQVLRRKVKVPLILGIPFATYWIVGCLSLVISLLFIGPYLSNFFPSVAALQYFRRIEYMILFFVGFASIKNSQDIRDFIKFLFLGVAAIVLYGLLQHFYPYFWKYLPEVLQKTNFCFPSFQTGNEEFAKGLPLCLPVGSRVTSTFGGHYDLAGYLLITLPIILGVWLLVKKKVIQVLLGLLYVGGLITLILTSSRIAFAAYLVAPIIPLILLKKKIWIIPVTLLTLACLVLFSESTIHRFAQTFRLTTVVVNMQGQVVGTTGSGLTDEQRRQLAKGNKAISGNEVIQGEVPEGSSFITLPQQKIATTSAVIRQGLSAKEAQRLQLANGGLQISSVKGNFSVQKALVYDISVTTRLQGEWPHAIASFLRSPLTGTGYSTLTLAVDNDFLRLLGETGILGFISFVAVFIFIGVYLRKLLPQTTDTLSKVFVYGLIGGVLGLVINATLFDIFEASKVAEPLWLMLGVGVGGLSLSQKKSIDYIKALLHVATSRIFIFVYLFTITIGTFWASINNFFIGDDFVWLKWAATSTYTDIPKYFTDAGGFFYRPLDKLLMLIFYSIFSLQPQGYHAVIILLHLVMGLGVYSLLHLLIKKKFWAFFGAVLFLIHPMHAENVYWISALSIDLSSVCILFATILFIKSGLFGSWQGVVRYIGSILLAIIALMSYELALIMPLLFVASDAFLVKKLSNMRSFLYVSFILLDGMYLVMRVVSHAFGMGGDYAYNLAHVIPNIVGNGIGYLGLFIFGQWSLPVYVVLRSHTKAFALPAVVIILLAIIVVIYLLRKTNWKRMIDKYNLPIFAVCFSLIALLPYLGLGNIAQRYGYLSSVGMVLLFVWILQQFFASKRFGQYIKYGIVGIVSLGIMAFCVVSLERAQSDWSIASKISYNILGFFKIEYPTIAHNSTFYIVNRPITYKDAWIFPVGLPEGLWFVYGDTLSEVVNVDSSKEALHLAKTKEHSYPFFIDNGFRVKEIQ